MYVCTLHFGITLFDILRLLQIMFIGGKMHVSDRAVEIL